MMRVLPGVAWSIALGLIIVGCAGRAPRASQGKNQATQEHHEDRPSHAVYSEQLREAMKRLQIEASRHWPENLDDEHHRAAESDAVAYREAAPLASALARTAEEIPASIDGLVLVESDRRAFRAQAETLRDQARRLQAAARHRDRAAVRAALAEIDASCRACHARFLDVSGPLSPL